MIREKIKILSLGDSFHFVNELRANGMNHENHYCFIQTDFISFQQSIIDYDILLFALEHTTAEYISSFFFNTSFKQEPPVILICNSTTCETEIDKVPFKNKLVFRNQVTPNELKHNIEVILKKSELEKKIQPFEQRVTLLDSEIKDLKKEIGNNRIDIEELSQTNFHLASATWRERSVKKQLGEELEKVKAENESNKLNIQELSATNEHLIAATWRERDLKKQLREAIESINTSKNIIEEQNKRIEQSINYSRRIQHAIHTKESDLKSILPQSSVYFKPKDVISGDFPWMFEKDDYVYIAAVDCTGHGVPGAMMSMIGNLLLNDLAHETGTHTPGQLLDRLHVRVIKTLKQDVADNNANDGMDIAMIRLHRQTNEILFASAHRPLLHITHKGEASIIKGDRFPIGGLHYEKNRMPFTDTCLKLEKDDMLFLFTDGLTDQIGGHEGKKIGAKAIFEILATMQKTASDKISDFVDQKFEEWKGTNKQIDDVLLIALRY